MSEPIGYHIRPAIVVPVLFSLGALVLGVTINAWALVAIPFIVLGSLCAAPNHNLADGFLVIVAAIIGRVVSKYHPDIGSAMVIGSVSSWFWSSIEKREKAIAIYDDKPPA